MVRVAVPTTPTVEQAFASVADFGVLDQWEPPVARSEWTVGQGPDVGSAVRLAITPWAAGAELLYRLEAVQLGGRFARCRGGTRRIRSVDTITCIERPIGSVVVVESDINVRGRWTPFAPIIRAGIAALGSGVLTPLLRRRLERRA